MFAAREKPLLFRGGVGVGAVSYTQCSLMGTAPTPQPPPLKRRGS